MSRTVLFSEVDEVSGRFPDYVAEIREVFLHAHLPDAAEEMLPAIADRIATDAAFREDLASMVGTVCALEPQISHLAVLGILIVAAVGAEQARVLAETPGVDLSARQVFNFVLESRRKRRDVMDGSDGPATDEAGAETVVADAAVEEATVEPMRPVPVAAVPAEKPLVTASAPGDSSMLARALALAAEDEVPAAAGETPVRPSPTERAREVDTTADVPTARERVGRSRDLPRVVRAAEPVDEDVDQEEAPPRRWGMWTAAACGVLLGFGLGVFAHFDHRTAPAVSLSTTGGGDQMAAQPAAVPAPAPVKHMTLAEELRADLALLGHGSHSGRAAAPHVEVREPQRAAVTTSGRTREAHRVPAPAEERRPTLVVRSAEPATAAPAPATGSARGVAVSSNGPAPLVAAARPVNLAGAGDAGNSFGRLVGVSALPRVTTGSAGVMAANLVSSPAPAYPAAASAAGVQGEVIVEAVVGRDGGVVDTRVVSGPLLLRAAALDAVQRWHYRPYEVDGKPIEVATTARLEFRLDH